MMETNHLILTKGIYDLLQTHLRTSSNLKAYNKAKLQQELKSAKVFANEDVPDNVVSVNRSIRITNIESEAEWVFHLVPPHEANIKNNKVSILAPVGVALLGYREGDQVEWEMPDGIKRFVIQSVSPIVQTDLQPS